MPEYLAPGVYAEEVSFRSKSVEGVGTSGTAFVGPTVTGPVGGSPELLTSFPDFERIYGGIDDLAFGADPMLNRNYVAHAARNYFDNGGARLYVVRAFTAGAGDGIADAQAQPILSTTANNVTTADAWWTGRFPGTGANNASVAVEQKASPIGGTSLANAADGTLLRVHPAGADWQLDGQQWRLRNPDGTLGADVAANDVNNPDKNVWRPLPPPIRPLTQAEFAALPDTTQVRVYPPTELWLRSGGVWRRLQRGATALGGNDQDVSDANIAALVGAFALSVDVEYRPLQGAVLRYEGLSTTAGTPRDVRLVLAPVPGRRADALTQPLALALRDGFSPTATALLTGLVGAQPGTRPDGSYTEPARSFTLSGGNEGALPGVQDYADALDLLVGLDDVSIVAAPGYSARNATDAAAIQDALLTHVGNPRRYRIGVLDAPPAQTPSTMRTLRGLVDSTRAAMYYPWVVVANPLAGPNSAQPAEILLPPSGFVCGIYARNDIERGVWKAPANEVVRGALRFERPVNHGEQEVLNPIGVNCLRELSGRGMRVWGARTISSDPEWKYVNVRRYFNYLEASIDRGTQWVVFEPNGELLWANLRGTISDFLFSEWKSGALLGGKPEEAFFVRCDRTTMTQNDLDNGRLICLIGVAVVKPAEFVIFRIGQKTADAKS